MKWRVPGWLSEILCLLAVFGTQSVAADSAPVTLSFWHSMGGAKGRLLAEIIEGFNAEHRGTILIQGQYVGSYEDGLNKLRTARLGGKGPHLVQITDIGQRVLIDSQSIVPLQDFIDRDPDFPLSQLLPAIRHYYEFKGRLFSLPFASSNPILYYNRDAFDRAGVSKPPGTFAELEETAKKLTNPSERKLGLTWPLNSWFLEQFMARQGAVLIEPDNGRTGTRAQRANFLSPEAIRFVSLWDRMTKAGTFANVGRGWDPAEQNFLAGRVAMLITSTSDIFEIQKHVNFKLGTAPIPSSGVAGSKGGTIIGGNSLWILNKKPESELKAAYAFVKYMASAGVQEKWHRNTGYFPIRADVLESLKRRSFYDEHPVAWVAVEQLRASPDLPATRGALIGVFPEVREHVCTAIEEVISGRYTVEEALRRAKARADFSLMRYNNGKELRD